MGHNKQLPDKDLEITLSETCLEAWPVLWYTINYTMIMIPPMNKYRALSYPYVRIITYDIFFDLI